MWRELKPSVTLCAYQGATLQNRPLGWPFVRSVCAHQETHTYEKFLTSTMPLLRVKSDDCAHTLFAHKGALCLRNQAAPITKNAYGDAVCADGAILQPDHEDS